MVGQHGIEPCPLASRANVLPLYDRPADVNGPSAETRTRNTWVRAKYVASYATEGFPNKMVGQDGIEPSLPTCEVGVLAVIRQALKQVPCPFMTVHGFVCGVEPLLRRQAPFSR